MSALGLIPEERQRRLGRRRVSEETIYSLTSSGGAPYATVTASISQQRLNGRPVPCCSGAARQQQRNGGAVAQRVLSAKRLRVKQLQNELAEARYQLHEIASENRLLKNLQKRQDSALAKYEDTAGALPRLLENHAAEVGALRSHIKALRIAARELQRRVTRRETEIATLQDQHDRLRKLADDTDMQSKVDQARKIDELEYRIKELEEKNSVLNRKLDLEQKSHAQALNAEIAKRKVAIRELSAARNESTKLMSLLQSQKEKMSTSGKHVHHKQSHDNQATSTVSLTGISEPKPQLEVKGASVLNASETSTDPLSNGVNNYGSANDSSGKDSTSFDVHLSSLDTSSEARPIRKAKKKLEKAPKILTSTDESTVQTKTVTFDSNDETPTKEITSSAKAKSRNRADKNSSDSLVTTDESTTSVEGKVNKDLVNSIQQGIANIDIGELTDINMNHKLFREDNESAPQICCENDNDANSDSEESDQKAREKFRCSYMNRRHDKEELDEIKKEIIAGDKNLRKVFSSDSSDDSYDSKENVTDRIARLKRNYMKKMGGFRIGNKANTGEGSNSDRANFIKPEYAVDAETDITFSIKKTRAMAKDDNSEYRRRSRRDSQAGSGQLEQIDESWRTLYDRMEKDREEMDTKLDQYCQDVLSDVSASNRATDRHDERLGRIKYDTDKIKKVVEVNSSINDQLKKGSRIDSSKKNQLLAALKAIDNGDEIQDPLATSSANKKKVMKELFDD